MVALVALAVLAALVGLCQGWLDRRQQPKQQPKQLNTGLEQVLVFCLALVVCLEVESCLVLAAYLGAESCLAAESYLVQGSLKLECSQERNHQNMVSPELGWVEPAWQASVGEEDTESLAWGEPVSVAWEPEG